MKRPLEMDFSAGFAHCIRPLAASVMLATTALLAPTSAAYAEPATAAIRVQQVTSPGGIKAWLMEDRTVPLVTVSFAFRGGNSQDRPGREGTASLLVNTIDEGAGQLSMTEFQRTLARLGVRVSFSSSDDHVGGSFATLVENSEQAVGLVRSMLMEPRFEQTSIDRVRALMLSQLAQRKKSPASLAYDRLRAVAYPGHAYGRGVGGSETSLAAITRADIDDFRRRVFARNTLVVSAAGAIDATALGNLLDRVFGDLPATAELTAVARVTPLGAGRIEVVDIDVPQSVAYFQLPGLMTSDPDYMAARVMTAIIGNGGFTSRLMKEIRIKRGLAYGVSASINVDLYTETWSGSVSSRNEAIKDAFDVVRAELKRMAAEGPTAEELDETKSSMIGGFALNFDTIGSMASLMQTTQLDGLGVDYFTNRSALIERVTVADVKRAATRLLDADRMLVVIAGRPKGLATSGVN